MFVYLNPWTLLRWAFFGRRLDEICDFEKIRNDYDAFHARTERQKARKEQRMNILAAQNKVHTDQMSQAKLRSDNLLVIMTQPLGKPAGEAAAP